MYVGSMPIGMFKINIEIPMAPKKTSALYKVYRKA